jgi:heme O synthase-like polyprenyltransferase
MGMWYFIPAAMLGALFMMYAARLFSDETKAPARTLFSYSLLYLALMCLAMVVDRII